MVRTKSRLRKLAFDVLEERTLLSGNCTAAVTGKGDLVIKCDKADNALAVEWYPEEPGYGEYVEVEGLDETTVNGFESVEFTGFTRDLRISTQGGDDYVYLYQLNVPRNLVVNGGGDADYLGGRYDINVAGNERVRVEAEGSVADDVMQLKLNQAIKTLTRPNQPEQVYMDAIDQGIESLFLSNLVVLPSNNDSDAQALFDVFRANSQGFADTLGKHMEGMDATGKNVRGLGTPGSKAGAGEARNFLQVTREALFEIGRFTVACDPVNQVTGAGCMALQADDEGGTVVDTVLGAIFSRQARSPFPFLLASTSAIPDEQVILTDPLADGECAAVIKEIQGLKLVVTPRLIPIWVEPWFARRRIVATTVVWVAEFVPAEHIKTISVCNVAGTIETDVDTQVVLERQLLHFWRFLHKDITAVA
jgi:hypothetical protein